MTTEIQAFLDNLYQTITKIETDVIQKKIDEEVIRKINILVENSMISRDDAVIFIKQKKLSTSKITGSSTVRNSDPCARPVVKSSC